MSKKVLWPKYNKTIPELFYGMAADWPDDTVFRYKKDGAWRDIAWKEAEDRVLSIAAGLIAEGLEPGSAVAILSGNRPEWAYADLGVLSAGVKNVPIYPTNTADQVAYILEDSNSEFVFVEDRSQLEKVLKVKDDLPNLRRAIVIEPYD
jgi:long-chain acyl-CoA synthetase